MNLFTESEQLARRIQWDAYLKDRLIPSTHFRAVTQWLIAGPNKPQLVAPFIDALPVLCGAVVDFSAPCIIEAFAPTDEYRLEGMLAFDTLHHGRVHVIVANVFDAHRDECTVRIGMTMVPTQPGMTAAPHAGLPLVIDSKDDLAHRHKVFVTAPHTGLAVVIDSKGDLTHRHTVFVTMLVPDDACQFCKAVSVKMSKCSSCWNEIRFPVRYCSKQCQVIKLAPFEFLY